MSMRMLFFIVKNEVHGQDVPYAFARSSLTLKHENDRICVGCTVGEL